jgi:hypothetical protein
LPEFQRWKVTFSDATTEEFNWPNLKSASGTFPAAGSVCFAGIISTKNFVKIELGYANGPPTDSSRDVFGWDDFYAVVDVAAPPSSPPVIPRAPSDCVPFFIAGPCPQECPVEVPLQVLTTGTAIPSPVPAPQFVWYCYQWFDGFGGFMAPGIPRPSLDCGRSFTVPAVLEQV